MSNDKSTKRSTLIALALVVLFFGSIAAYYGLRPRQVTATALFSVTSEPFDILGDKKPFDPREFDIFQRTQTAYLKSYFVVQSALNATGVSTLAILAPHEDKVQWVIDHVEAKFAENSEILSLSLSGPAEFDQDLVLLVDSLSDSYLKEVVFEEEQRRLVVRDAMQNYFAHISERVRNKLEMLHDLQQELGSEADSSVEIHFLKKELATLEKLLDELSMRLERAEILDMRPDRIRRIQKAMIDRD